MPTFAIQRGPTVLCSLDLVTQATSFHKAANHPDGILILEEAERVTFVLHPASEGVQYRIFIGDVPLSDLLSTSDDARGIDMGGVIYWRGWNYFESARGLTRLLLESQSEGSVVDSWKPVLRLDTYVLPSKLGEERYDRMTGDMEAVSRSLLIDLYGKSKQTHDVRDAKSGRVQPSREQELASILDVLRTLSELLSTIAMRPASRVVIEHCRRNYWGGEQMSPSMITDMCNRGISTQRAERPVMMRSQRRIESFDIPEHRLIRMCLLLLLRRASICAEAANEHAQAIRSERHLRHFRRGNEPSLYETMDLPKIRRLEMAVSASHRAIRLASSLGKLPFLSEARPELLIVRGGMFQRSREYQAVLAVIRQFLVQHRCWHEGSKDSTVTKLTSRLFEQWCFLNIVEAFRGCGLDLREWNDALRQNLRSRFILDFDRGLTFEGLLARDVRLRFRYEPWIFGRRSAMNAGETLCRGSENDVAWSPDVVIECLRHDGTAWTTAYAIVLDCKYRNNRQTFDDISKYSEIRSTTTMRQTVKQLWMITLPALNHPPSIASEDPAIRFDDSGPSCPPDETVRFRLSIAPEVDKAIKSDATSPDMFRKVAQGTIAFLRTHFAASKASNVQR